MRWRLVGPVAGLAALGAAVLVPSIALTSSHREAPQISQDPTADNTDTYAFVSPDAPGSATFVANYIPLEEPAGGPNFYTFSDKVRYSINIDNTGDGRDDISYRFRFHTKFVNPNTFLYATGPVSFDPSSGTYKNLNVVQTYDVQKVTRRGGKTYVRTIARNLLSPPDNAGNKSTPNYDQLVQPAVYTLKDGTKVFAGQRDDPFFVDLGATFDLVNLERRAMQSPKDAFDGVTGYNVHSIVLQVPKTQLTRKGNDPTDASSPDSVIGVYASADRPVVSFDSKGHANSSWKQVSRLGEPLINEVLIPLGRKDQWNASDPSDDAQFKRFYSTPELAADLNLLFNINAPTTNRNDLVAVLGTGLPPGNPFGVVTQIGKGKPAFADLIRLNLAVPPTPFAQQKRLGLLDGQLDGYPNGRRLIDDVVDIDLRAVAGVLLDPNAPGKNLGDGVDANDQPFLTSFPYVAPPVAGVEIAHPRPSTLTG
jgi:hypothetical protein